MLASIPEFREVDFSHLQFVDNDPDSAEPAPKRHSSFIWFALIISLLVHLSLLFFNLSLHQSPPQKAKHSLHVRLQAAPGIEPEVAPNIIEQVRDEPQLVHDIAQENIAAQAAEEFVVPSEKLPEPRPVSRVLLEPLTSQEFAEIGRAYIL